MLFVKVNLGLATHESSRLQFILKRHNTIYCTNVQTSSILCFRKQLIRELGATIHKQAMLQRKSEFEIVEAAYQPSPE